MTARRAVVIDGSAPVWAQRLETDLNGILAGIATDIDAATAALNAVISSVVPIGQIVDYTGSVLPAKFLWPAGQAISRETYAELFAVLGTTYNIGGEPGDVFRVPDLRGRVSAGKDDLGGTAVSRLTATSGMSGTTLGAAGGDQRLQAHTHTVNGDPSGAFGPSNIAGGGGIYVVQSTGSATGNTGSQGAGGSQNVQPTIILNKIIYAGV